MARNFPHTGNMAYLWLISWLVLFSSCYTYRVGTIAQAGSESSKPITAHSFFWGLIQKPKDFIHTPVCDSLETGLSEVIVKTNFGYSLVTVATLGIWSPVKVQWKCSKHVKKSGSL